MKRWIGSAGHSGRTSAHVSAVPKISASSASVTSSTKSFSALTTTASASVPTRNSSGSRPFARHASASLSLIARDALAMSVSAFTQNRSNPAPLPITSIVMFPPYPSSTKRSAIRSLNGATVELPAVRMSPTTASGYTAGSMTSSSSSPPWANTPATGTSSASVSTIARVLDRVRIVLFPSCEQANGP